MGGSAAHRSRGRMPGSGVNLSPFTALGMTLTLGGGGMVAVLGQASQRCCECHNTHRCGATVARSTVFCLLVWLCMHAASVHWRRSMVSLTHAPDTNDMTRVCQRELQRLVRQDAGGA